MMTIALLLENMRMKTMIWRLYFKRIEAVEEVLLARRALESI
jgi:hypothetical protein